MADEFSVLEEYLISLPQEVKEQAAELLFEGASIPLEKIIADAPYDPDNSGEHLKDQFYKKKDGYKTHIFVNRGEKDKHVFKVVVREFGRTSKRRGNLKPRPFIRPAVDNTEAQVINYIESNLNLE